MKNPFPSVCIVAFLLASGQVTLTKAQLPPTISSLSSSAGNKIILPKTGSVSVNIICAVDRNASSVTFQWTLNGGIVPGSDQFISNGVGWLRISLVTPAHGGTYRCSTSNRVGNDFRELTLTVVESPTVDAIRVNGSNVMGGVVHALNGTTSNFACAVSGTSPLTTSWELQTMSGESNRTGSTFSSLLTQNDEGIYTCVVVNEQEGLSDNATVTVRVFDPIALMSVAMTALEYNENDNVTLSCSFFKDLADPDVFPRVLWNGPSGYYRTQLANETTPTTFESTVTFTATRQYHGQFTCSVNDVGVGTIAAMFQLTVYYRPTRILLQATPASVNIGSSTTITCTGNSRPPPQFTITRRLPDGTESTSSGATYVLRPTSKEELGSNLLTCSATNSKYSIPVPSATHRILIKGVPEVVNSDSIRVTNRSFTSVSVQWTKPQDNFDTILFYQFQLRECERNINYAGSPCKLVRTFQQNGSYSMSPYYTLENLSPFTTYTLEIAASNGVGLGPFSNAVVVQTVQQDEATVKRFTATLQGNTVVLFQWHAAANLTRNDIAFSYFHLTRMGEGFPEEVNVTLPLRDAQCSNITVTDFCHEWEGFAAGDSYSVWIEMVYSYPATGGRVTLTVTIPPAIPNAAAAAAGGTLAGLLVAVGVTVVVVVLVVLGCRWRRKGGKRCEGDGADAEAVAAGNVSYSRRKKDNECLDKTDNVKYSRSGTIGGDHYEPLRMNQVDHHSYSKCTYGGAAVHVGGQEHEYASLDVSTMQDAQYALPVSKGGSAHTCTKSVTDSGYVQLQDPVLKEKPEMHESKMEVTAFDQGAAADTNLTGYANTGFASVKDSHKDTPEETRKQEFANKVLKGKTKPTPTMAGMKQAKKQTGSEPATGANVNDAVKPVLDSPTSPSAAVEKQPQGNRAPLQLAPPEAAMQESKAKKPQTKGKKPVLPKHITEATTPPSSCHKGRSPAASAPPPAIKMSKRTPEKGAESTPQGKVSVAELARRLEKRQ